jgi:hypothetical protein
LIIENGKTPINSKVHIVNQLREALSQFENAAIRKRAVSVLKRIISDNISCFQKIEEHSHPFDELPEDEKKFLKDIIQLADSAAMTIYFSSGAFAEKETNKSRGRVLSVEEKSIFFDELSPIIQTISQIPYASVIHHLVETLESLIPANPRGVFLIVNSVVKAGLQGGYQYESMAVDHIVHIVERYLAEFRLTLRENADCQNALLEILDTFVDAGWPSARKLTYRLEEIYR